MAAPERFAKRQTRLLHRGRRPYIALNSGSLRRSKSSVIEISADEKCSRLVCLPKTQSGHRSNASATPAEQGDEIMPVYLITGIGGANSSASAGRRACLAASSMASFFRSCVQSRTSASVSSANRRARPGASNFVNLACARRQPSAKTGLAPAFQMRRDLRQFGSHLGNVGEVLDNRVLRRL
jgi:hypothetical protein